ncbi:hypothetical protein [Riemerella columbina]|nr:hypothetical protein [Riemerella columbina]
MEEVKLQSRQLREKALEALKKAKSLNRPVVFLKKGQSLESKK